MRTGVIARKEGMSRIFSEEGYHIPVTVLKIDNCQVIATRQEDKDGYIAVQLGAGEAKVSRTSKAQRGHFAKAKVELKKKVAEFRVSGENVLELGAKIGANHFIVGQFVDVRATSKGKGFAGAMKRHNFGGLRASHGVKKAHRSMGSTGQCQDPGKVFKGKKMPGQMGNKNVCVQNLEVVAIDPEENLVLVKGAVPGANQSWVTIVDAVKKPLPAEAPMPAGLFIASNSDKKLSADEGDRQMDQAESLEKSASAEPVPENATTSDEAQEAAVDKDGSQADKKEEK